MFKNHYNIVELFFLQKEITNDPQFSIGDFERCDMDQGQLGNCWFIAGKYLISKLFGYHQFTFIIWIWSVGRIATSAKAFCSCRTPRSKFYR